jgi:hypothetical protein
VRDGSAVHVAQKTSDDGPHAIEAAAHEASANTPASLRQ